MKIKKHDFIELDYVGRIKTTNQIFDLTIEDVAKKEHIHNEKFKYEPITICVGENNIIPGIDEFLIDKDLGSYTVEVPPEKAFGNKDAKLIRVMPIKLFLEKKINPVPGLQINIDNLIGTIRSVSGGRIIVDFNHPLAGKHLIYEIKIKSILTNDEEKLKSLVKMYLNSESKLEDSKAIIKTEIPVKLQEEMIKKLKELLPNIKEVIFEKQNNKEKTNNK